MQFSIFLLTLLSTWAIAAPPKCQVILRNYPSPVLVDVELDGKNPIFLKPEIDPEIIVDRDHPIMQSLNKIWDLQQFRKGRTPLKVGELHDPKEFAKPHNIRVADLPIKMMGSVDDYRLPADLAPFRSVVQQIINYEHSIQTPEKMRLYYAYLTIQQTRVEKGKSQRRLGSHVDGFQGVSIKEKKEVNHSYLVSNLTPTVFYTNPFDFSGLVEGVHDYYAEMDRQSQEASEFSTVQHSIYLMDGYSVHRADIAKKSGYRTFLRLSYEREVFDRLGNTHNPLFEYEWKMTERPERPPFLRIDYTMEELMNWLTHSSVEAEKIIQFVSINPMAKVLLNEERSGWIGEHSSQAIEFAKTQKDKYNFSVDLEGSLYLALALHDTGKPLVGVDHHSVRSRTVAREVLRSHRVEEKYIAVVENLIAGDTLGQLLQNKISTSEAARELKEQANSVGLVVSQWYELKSLFTISDMATYSRLKEDHLQAVGSKFEFRSNIFRELEQQLEL